MEENAVHVEVEGDRVVWGFRDEREAQQCAKRFALSGWMATFVALNEAVTAEKGFDVFTFDAYPAPHLVG